MLPETPTATLLVSSANMKKRHVAASDAFLGLAAMVVSLPSLAYPFGRDQGLFYYVGREWLLRGSIPYRDVWDHKPPLIYAAHALAISIFGEHMWSIRLLELPLLATLGWLGARVVTARGQATRPGAWGAAWLFASVIYFGCLGFWDTAQCEVWTAVLGLGSVTAVLRLRSERAGALLGGALGAASLWFKPSSAFFALVAAVALAGRLKAGRLPASRLLEAVCAFALGGTAVSLAIVGYFGWNGALEPMREILLGANAHYLSHEMPDRQFGEFQIRLALFEVFGPILIVPMAGSTAALGLFVIRRRTGIAQKYGLHIALVFAAIAAVIVQLKFYVYHWGSLPASAAVFGAAVFDDVSRFCERSSAGRAVRLLPSLGFLGAVLLLFTGTPSHERFLRYVDVASSSWLKRQAEQETARAFDDDFLNYSFSESVRVGKWLDEYAAPNDHLAVRGFEPQIYALSGLGHRGRFFWTMFLTDPRRAYNRAEWRREDEEVFRRTPPRFVVGLIHAGDVIDRCSWFEQFGYTQVESIGRFCISERVAALR